MERPAVGISVTELNRIIGGALRSEPRLRGVTVTAEISGFKRHLASGHWYFSLKDRESAIACVMFRQNNVRAAILPRDGDAVTVTGYVELFARDGRVQLYVMELRPAGVGSLYERFEALKRKLMAEGLFDPGRKRLLPQVPRKVAVITSASGAALHDVLNVSGRRSPAIPLVLVPSGVQGAAAAGEIVSALESAARIPGVEVIILARGGGSPEDLWCFNEEIVARAIAACPLPVVTGVGHETDSTIADYAADVRASTPSNAAEIVFPDRRELVGRVELFRADLTRAVVAEIHQAHLRLHASRDRLSRLSPERRLLTLTDQAHQCRQRLSQAVSLALRGWEEELRARRAALNVAVCGKLTGAENGLSRCRVRLEAVSPLRVLDRGYALVTDPGGRVLPSARAASAEEKLLLRFADGRVAVRPLERDGKNSPEGVDGNDGTE